MTIKDIPPGEVEILDGYVGKLTSEQSAKLKEMWEQFFQAVTKNDKEVDESEVEGGGGDADQDDGDNDPSKSGIPKGDAAKDELKKAQERKEFTDMIDKYGSRKLRETFWLFNKGDNPDTSMLRFLRARKWDVDRALAMLGSCMKWRIENKVEEMAFDGELGCASIPHFLEQNGTGKTYAQGTSGNEQPIAYIHVRKHRTFGQPSSSMSKFVIFAMESFRLFMVPPNDKIVLLFDMTGFGLSSMDWNCILFLVKCLEAYYPESLGKLFIHNAPLVFKGCWMILKPLLDPVVRNKVAFTYKPEELQELIPSERLIAELGGTQTFEWEFEEPKDGENDQLKDKAAREKVWKEYLDLAGQIEQITRKATFEKGDSASKERDILIKKLRIKNFELEKHSRGMTVYHRKGIIRGDGVVTWHYPQKNGEVLRHSVGHRYSAEALQQQIDEDLTADEWQEKYGEAFNKRLRKEEGADEDDDEEDDLDVDAALGPKPGKLAIMKSKVTKGPSILEKREAEKEKLVKEHEEKKEQKKKEKEEKQKKEEEARQKKEGNEQANGSANGDAGNGGRGYLGGLKMAALSLGNKAADYTPAAIGGNKLKEATSTGDGENGEAK